MTNGVPQDAGKLYVIDIKRTGRFLAMAQMHSFML